VDHNTGKLVREAIALNPDVGGCTLIYDGRKTLTASFCPQGFGENPGSSSTGGRRCLPGSTSVTTRAAWT
jgi:hypothetical protein